MGAGDADPLWANRYDSRFEVAQRFLTKSVCTGDVFVALAVWQRRALPRGHRRDRRADGRQPRGSATCRGRGARGAERDGEREQQTRRGQQAVHAGDRGAEARKERQAAELQRQAQQVEQQASARPVLTPSELTELDRLRKQESAWQRTEADLRQQLAAQRTARRTRAAGARNQRRSDIADLERLRKAESNWEPTQQQLAAAKERATKAQQAESALRKTNEELQARLAEHSPRRLELSMPPRRPTSRNRGAAPPVPGGVRKTRCRSRDQAVAIGAGRRVHAQLLAVPVVHDGDHRPEDLGHGRPGRGDLRAEDVGRTEGRHAPEPTPGVVGHSVAAQPAARGSSRRSRINGSTGYGRIRRNSRSRAARSGCRSAAFRERQEDVAPRPAGWRPVELDARRPEQEVEVGARKKSKLLGSCALPVRIPASRAEQAMALL